MLVQISKEDMDTLFRIIDKYDVNDEEIDAIERLTDYDMNRENQEQKLTLEQIRKLEKLEELFYTALQTYIKKNMDYGDSFSKSYKEFGLTAPIVRMSDKMERLKSLSKADARVKDESIRDTLIDLGNYAFMTVVEMDIEDENNKANEEEFKHVINKRLENAEKIKKETLKNIMQTLERINGLGIEDKDTLPLNRPYDHLFDMYVDEHEDYDQGDKLNI